MTRELSPTEAEGEWKSGQFRPVYLLIGENAFAKTAFISQIKETLKPDDFNYNEYSLASPNGLKEAISTALTPPMISEKRLVVLKCPKLGVDAKKELTQYLKEPSLSTVLIIVTEDRKTDYRDALTAECAVLEGIVLFKPLREEEAVARLREAAIRAQRTLAEDAGELLVEECGTDWGILRAELEKLIAFSKESGEIRREDVLVCLGYRQASNPFDFPKVVLSRKKIEALKMLRQQLLEGIEPMKILYQISSAVQKQLKAKRMVRAGRPEGEIFKELRLHAYYDKDFLRQLSSVSEGRLASELNACLTAEVGLKSKAWLDAGIELERLLAALMR